MPLRSSYAVEPTDLEAAARRIGPFAHRTPVLTCSTLDERAGRRLFFKCENLQKIGAFKFRGACNAVMKLSDEAAARGVATHSSGNHAQALALAARMRGLDAHIVMPRTALACKRRAVEEYGARVYECEPTQQSRETTCARVIKETGATLVPPYDHPDIIAGQGTAARELLEQVDDLDVIVAPVGGGGLLSGTCIAAHTGETRVLVVGAEPAGADDAARSLAAGRLIPLGTPETICDGLRTSLGELTWPIIRDHVRAIITIGDDEVLAAMRLVWERMKILIEPSAAVSVAVVLSERFRAQEGLVRVGVILSGGNVDLDTTPWSAR